MIRTTKFSYLAVVALSVFTALSPGLKAAEDESVAPIANLYRALIETMQQAKQLGIKGRFEKLAPALANTYDIAGMAKTSVGPAWDTLKPEQQTSIVAAFNRLIVANYANRFDGYSGEKFEITQTADQANGRLVKTQIVQSSGKTIPLNYVMRNSSNGWRVVDLYLDGTISELASRRAEFSSILKSGGADALIASLKQQADKLLSGT